jgi:hypothetical protein
MRMPGILCLRIAKTTSSSVRSDCFSIRPSRKIRVLLQRRGASAPRFGRAATLLPKTLDPDNRRTGTELKLLGCLVPRTFPLPQSRAHACPQNRPSASPASQKRINADKLSYLSPHENPPDSIGAEHAPAACLLPKHRQLPYATVLGCPG